LNGTRNLIASQSTRFTFSAADNARDAATETNRPGNCLRLADTRNA
jgi:hypothetical protein